MTHRNPSTALRGRTWTALLPWAAGLALAAFAGGAQLVGSNGVQALTEARTADSDLDGLPDVLEEVLYFDQDRRDSDRDGWGDAEELARGSDAKDPEATPDASTVGLSVDGYHVDGVMHVVLSIYQKGGPAGDHAFQLGAYWNGRRVLLSPSQYLPFTDVHVVEGQQPGDTIHVLDISLPGRIVERLENVSFFLTGTEATAPYVTDADALNVTISQGAPWAIASLSGGGGLPKASAGGRRSIFKPLVPKANAPNNSASGKVCVQTTRIVGAGGASVQLEVVSGSCEDGDGTCPSSCTTSAGSSFDILDPLVLIGG